jgi:hypothetical protein
MWELIFMLVILKIPIIYLCCVVYWAIKAEPRPSEGAARLASVDPDQPTPWHRRLRRPRFPIRPHGSPSRTYPRKPVPERAEAEVRH